MKNINDANILVFGAGAIGASVGAWLSPHHKNLFFFDKPEVAEALNTKGITMYMADAPKEQPNYQVMAYSNLDDLPQIDIILLAVKNYSLDAVSKLLVEKFGRDPIVVALQNGIENQEILPKYFNNIIYSVVGYNAWIDRPGVIGYQKKGPLVLGTIDNNELVAEKKAIAELLNIGVETSVTDDFQSTAYSKLVVNLANSLTTLIGFKYQEVSSLKLFQKILSNMAYEGVQIAKAMGHKESLIGGMPSWKTIKMAAKLPHFITKGIFKKNIKKMVLSSMAQDIIQRKGEDSELESINGHFVKMAKKYNVDAPYNKKVYEICQKKFAEQPFKPMDVKEVWEELSR